MYLPPASARQSHYGVTITIPTPWAAQLRATRLLQGDPDALLVDPHITVLNPVALTPGERKRLDQQLRRVSAQLKPFVVQLGGLADFRPASEVYYTPLLRGADNCLRAHRELAAAGFAPSDRFPYHPHVTICQDAAVTEPPRDFTDFQALFVADCLRVHRLDEAGFWHPEQRYPLQLPGGATDE